jgi:LacI family transcriptional regulator
MSMKDVAREAGVSTATVSHVINNTRKVTEETRRRVLDAIERCHYYPNAHARTLASGRSKLLGLVVTDIASAFFPEVVRSVQWAASDRGYDVILVDTNYSRTQAAVAVRRLIERKVTGVALLTTALDSELIAELTLTRMPIVYLNQSSASEQTSNVVVDCRSGFDEAALHLAELGHQRIAFISGPENLRSTTVQLEAFEAAFAEYLSCPRDSGPPPAPYRRPDRQRCDGAWRPVRVQTRGPCGAP